MSLDIRKAQKHIQRAAELLNGGELGFGVDTRRTKKHKVRTATAHIRTLEDVAKLESAAKLSTKDAKRVIDALLRYVHDPQMSTALMKLLERQCSGTSTASDCRNPCVWRKAWFWGQGTCRVNQEIATLQYVTKNKNFLSMMMGIANILWLDRDAVDTTVARKISSICEEHMKKDIQMQMDTIQTTFSEGAQEMKQMIINIEDDLTISGKLSDDVKMLYIAMFVQIEFIARMTQAIQSSEVGSRIHKEIGKIYSLQSGTKRTEDLVTYSLKCIALLATALFFVPQGPTKALAALHILQVLPIYARVLQHQANSARNRSMHDISKQIIHCMHAFNMRGAVHNTVSFGTLEPTDPGQLMPTEHAAAAVANDLSVIKEENKRVNEDRKRTWEKIASSTNMQNVIERLSAVPEKVRDDPNLGSNYMQVIAKNSDMGNRPLSEWTLIGTHNSISEEGHVSAIKKIWNTVSSPWRVCQGLSVMQQMNAGARILDVRPYLNGFNAEGTPNIIFHHDGFTNGSYDIHNLIGDVLNFVDEHEGEIITLYFGNTDFNPSLKEGTAEQQAIVANRVFALREILRYTTEQVPKDRIVMRTSDRYETLVERRQQIMIVAETINGYDDNRIAAEQASVTVHNPSRGEALHGDFFDPTRDHPIEVKENLRNLAKHIPLFPHVDRVVPNDETQYWQTGARPTYWRGQDIASSIATLLGNLGKKAAQSYIWFDHFKQGDAAFVLPLFEPSTWG